MLSRRSGVTDDCRRQRRTALAQWDAAEEKVFSANYEQTTLNLRGDLNRLASLYRKKAAEGKDTALKEKFEARREAVDRAIPS